MAELTHHTPGELQTASEQEQSATIEAINHPPLCVKCGGSCEAIGTVRICFDCNAVQLSPVLEPLNKYRT